MKTFLDFGTNYFGGLDQFTKLLGINQEWNVKCYEADPHIYAQTIGSHDFTNYNTFSHQNLAIADRDADMVINCVKSVLLQNVPGHEDGVHYGDFGGSSLVDRRNEVGPLTVNESVRVVVRSIDVNRILDEIIIEDESAEIVIKCDIEGGEYAALRRLISSPHLHHVDSMYVEWHSRFFGDRSSDMLELERMLKDILAWSGVKLYDWV